MNPNERPAPIGSGAGQTIGVRGDDGILSSAIPPRKIECCFCSTFFPRRNGGRWSDLLCGDCEARQPEITHLGGGRR